MNQEKKLFPQEWGVHLLEGVEPQPTCGIYPDGMHRLRFEDMHATQFEQFCLWLLRKENEVCGCLRLGGKGCKQDGIDLFGYDKFIPDNLIVYECKCWHELDSGELTNTVERFLNGEWSNDAKKFVLIIAQPDLAYIPPPSHLKT